MTLVEAWVAVFIGGVVTGVVLGTLRAVMRGAA